MKNPTCRYSYEEILLLTLLLHRLGENSVEEQACTELEKALCAELGERRDWWLLSGGKVAYNERSGATVRWIFPHGVYEAWLPDNDVWRIRLPNGHIVFARRWLLQATLWRSILRYKDLEEHEGSQSPDSEPDYPDSSAKKM